MDVAGSQQPELLPQALGEPANRVLRGDVGADVERALGERAPAGVRRCSCPEGMAAFDRARPDAPFRRRLDPEGRIRPQHVERGTLRRQAPEAAFARTGRVRIAGGSARAANANDLGDTSCEACFW